MNFLGYRTSLRSVPRGTERQGVGLLDTRRRLIFWGTERPNGQNPRGTERSYVQFLGTLNASAIVQEIHGHYLVRLGTISEETPPEERMSGGWGWGWEWGGIGIDEWVSEENSLGEPSGDQDQIASQVKGIRLKRRIRLEFAKSRSFQHFG